MDAKTFFTTEIDGEIERVNSITGVSSVSKEPRQTNLFTD